MSKSIWPATTFYSVAECDSRFFVNRHSVRRGNMFQSVRSVERADIHVERDNDGHWCHTAGLLV